MHKAAGVWPKNKKLKIFIFWPKNHAYCVIFGKLGKFFSNFFVISWQEWQFSKFLEFEKSRKFSQSKKCSSRNIFSLRENKIWLRRVLF